MTAVIHHGPPGSYKTFSLVQRVVIPALKAGRVVVTNIRGLNDLDAIRAIAGDIPDTATIYYLEPNTEGFDAMARFHHWAPAGALIAMDEGQRVYPTRLKNFDSLDQAPDIPISDSSGAVLTNAATGEPIFRPATVEIAFDMHRHFNWDIYISTPNIAKIHSEIRKVVEWAFRHRNNSGLLPWYKNTWTEFRHDSEQSGKSASHYSGTPKRYKADQKIFGAYQSTATGKAKNTTENISIFRDPKLRFLSLVLLVCLSYFGYNVKSAFDRIAGPAADAQSLVVESHDQGDLSNAGLSAGVSGHVSSNQVSSPSPGLLKTNPFYGADIYYTGRFNDDFLLFEVHDADNVIHVTASDLKALGFDVISRNRSFVVLSYFGHRILAFTRQAPAMAARSDYGAKAGQSASLDLSALNNF